MNLLAESGSGLFLIWMGSVKLKSMMGMALLAAAASVLAWSGWALYRERYPSWYEEVRLSDGRIITIKQRRRYYENYGTAESWVTIDLPELGGKRVWHSFLMPQRIDVHEGKVYVFGQPRGIKQNQYYRYPKNYMVGFVWNGADFVRIPFLSIPENIRNEENVYPCERSQMKVISIVEKDGQWCPVRGDRWKFGKKIILSDYRELAAFYARLGGGEPISD